MVSVLYYAIVLLGIIFQRKMNGLAADRIVIRQNSAENVYLDYLRTFARLGDPCKRLASNPQPQALRAANTACDRALSGFTRLPPEAKTRCPGSFAGQGCKIERFSEGWYCGALMEIPNSGIHTDFLSASPLSGGIALSVCIEDLDFGFSDKWLKRGRQATNQPGIRTKTITVHLRRNEENHYLTSYQNFISSRRDPCAHLDYIPDTVSIATADGQCIAAIEGFKRLPGRVTDRCPNIRKPECKREPHPSRRWACGLVIEVRRIWTCSLERRTKNADPGDRIVIQQSSLENRHLEHIRSFARIGDQCKRVVSNPDRRVLNAAKTACENAFSGFTRLPPEARARCPGSIGGVECKTERSGALNVYCGALMEIPNSSTDMASPLRGRVRLSTCIENLDFGFSDAWLERCVRSASQSNIPTKTITVYLQRNQEHQYQYLRVYLNFQSSRRDPCANLDHIPDFASMAAADAACMAAIDGYKRLPDEAKDRCPNIRKAECKREPHPSTKWACGAGGKKNRQKERRLMKGFNIAPTPSSSVLGSGPGVLPPEFIASFQNVGHHGLGPSHELFESLHSGLMGRSSGITMRRAYSSNAQNLVHMDSVHRSSGKYKKRNASRKKRWESLIEAAITGRVGRFMSKSRSEDSVCEPRGNGASPGAETRSVEPSEREHRVAGEALAALRRKRENFASASKHLGHTAGPKPQEKETSKLHLKRAASVPVQIPDPGALRLDQTQSVDSQSQVQSTLSPSTTDESVTAEAERLLIEPYNSSASGDLKTTLDLSRDAGIEFKGPNGGYRPPNIPGVQPLSGHTNSEGWL